MRHVALFGALAARCCVSSAAAPLAIVAGVAVAAPSAWLESERALPIVVDRWRESGPGATGLALIWTGSDGRDRLDWIDCTDRTNDCYRMPVAARLRSTSERFDGPGVERGV